jgi:hypothetical protein
MSNFRFSALCGLLVAIPACAFAEDIAPTALNSLSAVPRGMSSAQVMDQNGQVLGTVQQVQTSADGRPSALSFRASKDGHIVVVAANAVSYDGHVLVTSNDQPQIAALSAPPPVTRTAQVTRQVTQ